MVGHRGGQAAIDYIKASQSTNRPLRLAGFDSQLNAVSATEHLAADLRSFVGVLRDAKLRTGARELAEEIITAHQHLFARAQEGRQIELDSTTAAISGKTLAQSPQDAMAAWEKSDAAKLTGRREDIEALDRATEGLLALLRTERVAFQQVHAARHITFMERVIENLRGNDQNLYDSERPDRPTGAAASALINRDWNLRDTLNARNLQWLVEKGYPGRKIIVWAHNVHLMNAYYAADLNSIHSEPQAGGLEPSGVTLHKWLGKQLYTIAITSYGGEDGWNAANPLATAPEGSLEWRLHQLGKPYLFVDLRSVSDNAAHPMHRPQSIRIDKYRADTLTDVTRVFDGIFYVDRMTAATRIHSSHP